MYEDITGIILSGGRSVRMGSNKSLIELGGMTAIERTVELMSGLFPKLILSTNTPNEFAFLGLEMVEDLHHDVGPLAGIHAGLSASNTDRNFIIPCDMPLMTAAVIRLLVEAPTDRRITVADAEGCIQQLPGLFHRSCIPVIEAIIDERADDAQKKPNGKRRGCRVSDLFDRVHACAVDCESEIPGAATAAFRNMNDTDDLSEIKRLLT